MFNINKHVDFIDVSGVEESINLQIVATLVEVYRQTYTCIYINCQFVSLSLQSFLHSN